MENFPFNHSPAPEEILSSSQERDPAYYLEKAKSGVRSIEYTESEPDFLSRINEGSSEPVGESGHTENIFGNYRATVAYETPDPETVELLQGASLIPEGSGNWREITQFIVSANDKTADIIDAIPADCPLVTHIGESEYHTGYLLERTKDEKLNRAIVLLGMNVGSPQSVFIALHELGHIIDQTTDGQSVSHGMHHNIAEQMRQERTATAFALSKVRSFTKPGDTLRKDASRYLLDICLNSYNQAVDSKINEETSRSQTSERAIRDSNFDDDWDGSEMAKTMEEFALFEQFKNTAAYSDWKSLDGNAELDEFEEQSAWFAWCEAAGINPYDLIPEQ